MNKKKACFTISENVLNEFKEVTGIGDRRMSSLLEAFMIDYIDEKTKGV